MIERVVTRLAADTVSTEQMGHVRGNHLITTETTAGSMLTTPNRSAGST